MVSHSKTLLNRYSTILDTIHLSHWKDTASKETSCRLQKSFFQGEKNRDEQGVSLACQPAIYSRQRQAREIYR